MYVWFYRKVAEFMNHTFVHHQSFLKSFIGCSKGALPLVFKATFLEGGLFTFSNQYC